MRIVQRRHLNLWVPRVEAFGDSLCDCSGLPRERVADSSRPAPRYPCEHTNMLRSNYYSKSSSPAAAIAAFVAWCALCSGAVAAGMSTSVVPPWRGTTVRDLHREYQNVFRYGNRNAASHRWATFLFERSSQMNADRLKLMFSGFCAVSGSPITPSDYNKYQLELSSVSGQRVRGFMHYCCWPCVCDTQDFIKVDTKTVTLQGGEKREFHFAVIGNPCEHPEELHKPFVQPFDGRSTTLARDAAEVRCNEDGSLEGATLSDHGYPIINMFFDAEVIGDNDAVENGSASATVVVARQNGPPQPGRMTTVGGVSFQSEYEYANMCTSRAQAGYNSGMGEIFRRVAMISPVPVGVVVKDLQ